MGGSEVKYASTAYAQGVRGTTLLPAVPVTGTASTDLIASPKHGLSAGNAIKFPSLTGGAGLTANTLYYVIADGLTLDAYKVSATITGTAIDITTDITAGIVVSQDYVLSDETSQVNAAIRLVDRTFVEAGDTLYEIGNRASPPRIGLPSVSSTGTRSHSCEDGFQWECSKSI